MSDSTNKGLTDQDFQELPFSPDVQEGLLGYVLLNPTFFAQIKPYLEPEWFASLYHQKIFRYLKVYHSKYAIFPSIDDLCLYVSLQADSGPEKDKTVSTIRLAVFKAQNMQTAQLADHLTVWLKSRLYYFGISESSRLYNKKDFEGAFARIGQAHQDISKASVNLHEELEWTDPMSVFQAQRLEMDKACTWGLKIFDDLLLPGNTHGSLLPGDMTVILAPTNIGKTTSMITVAAANVVRQKHVLFMFHEGRASDIQLKIWCNILKVSQMELMDRYKQQPDQVERLSKILSKFLTLVPVFKPGLTVEEVEAVIERKWSEHRDKYGHGFDLIVDDYPAKLTTAVAKNGGFQFRNMQQYVYNYFVQIALTKQAHVLAAIQTNREGSKINKNSKDALDHRLIMLEDANETFGPMQDVTNVVSYNRSPQAEARERATYLICKSRSSKVNLAVACKTDFGHACTHSDALGATWYHGTSPMEDKIDDLLLQHRGNEVPFDKLIA